MSYFRCKYGNEKHLALIEFRHRYKIFIPLRFLSSFDAPFESWVLFVAAMENILKGILLKVECFILINIKSRIKFEELVNSGLINFNLPLNFLSVYIKVFRLNYSKEFYCFNFHWNLISSHLIFTGDKGKFFFSSNRFSKASRFKKAHAMSWKGHWKFNLW